MKVAFVVVQDDTVQYLVEVFATDRSRLGLIRSAQHEYNEVRELCLSGQRG